MSCSVKNIDTTNNRINASLFCFGNSHSILIINVYFPVDDRRRICQNVDLFVTLKDIKFIIDNNNFNSLVIGGDLNSDFLRDTGFVDNVRSFVDTNDLSIIWNFFEIDYTYLHYDGRSTSKIDHFILNSCSMNKSIDAGVLHLPTNNSPHSPIYIKLSISYNINSVNSDNNSSFRPRYLFSKASRNQIENWQCQLDDSLISITNPVICPNVNCNDLECKNKIDNFTTDILYAINSSCDMFIPKNIDNQNNDNSVPGWNNYVKPFKNDSIFHFNLWVSAGKPHYQSFNNNNLHPLFINMKKYRNLYHYAVRA